MEVLYIVISFIAGMLLVILWPSARLAFVEAQTEELALQKEELQKDIARFELRKKQHRARKEC